MDRRTDGRTDGQMIAIAIPPPNFVCGGGSDIEQRLRCTKVAIAIISEAVATAPME